MELRLLNSIEHIETVRAFWTQHERHPNASYELFRTVLETRQEVLRPHVLALEEEGETRALVLGRVEAGWVPCKLGYLKVCCLKLRTLVVLHEGIIGELEAEQATHVGKALLQAMQSGEVDRVHLSHQKEGSALLDYLLLSTSSWARGFIMHQVPHWLMDLPSAPGEFFAGLAKPDRKKVARRRRNLEFAVTEPLSVRQYRSVADLSMAFSAMERIAERTYQRGLGVGFRDDDLHGRRYRAEAEAGRFRAWVLYAGEQPIAFRTGFVYGTTYHGATTAYDQCFRDYGVGTLLLIEAIDALVTEGVRVYDWGLGDAEHKNRYGTSKYCDLDFCLYANSVRGISARIAVAGTRYTERAAKALLSRLGVAERLKRRLRKGYAEATKRKIETPLS